MASGRIYPHYETRLLIVVTAILVVFGIAAVYGASGIVAVRQGDPGSTFAIKQLMGALVGAVVVMVVSRLDYHIWQSWAWWIMAVVTVMLLMLIMPITSDFALQRNGATRWLALANISFQPSEIAKLAVVMWAAKLATKKRDEEVLGEFRRGILPFAVVVAPTALLILLEPDLSTAFLYCVLVGVILFAAGAKLGHFLILGVMAVAFVSLWELTESYQFTRFYEFFSRSKDLAESGWQVNQSVIGLGSGQLFGQGFGVGMQKLGYLPYAYSDFIFSTIGEELGFLGVSILLLCLGIFGWAGLEISKTAPDLYGSLLAVGITAMILVTAMLHIAVTLDLVPTTGLPLPFISYGRSNLLVSLAATGILINIGMQRRVPIPKRSER